MNEERKFLKSKPSFMTVSVIIGIIIVAAAVVAAATVFTVKKINDSKYVYPNQPAISKGKAAPDFTVKLLSGDEFTLSSCKGKVVLINFWATWCRPCCEEMPAFERLKTEYGDGIVVLAVNCGESADDIRRFVSENGYTFDFAIDETAKISTSVYPTDSIPYTVIIDKNGNIVKTYVGANGAEAQYRLYKSCIEGVFNEK